VRLSSALLANSAEQHDGLIFMLGGGWDTRFVPQGGPLTFSGALVLRLMAHRTECGTAHQLEIRCMHEDGALAFQLGINNLTPQIPPGFPIEWEVPVAIVVELGAILPSYGKYDIAVLADNVFLGSMPFRITDQMPPAGPVHAPGPQPEG
jgi:hypothetical protein